MDGKVKVKGHLDETKVVNNTFFSTYFSSSKQPHNFKDELGCPKKQKWPRSSWPNQCLRCFRLKYHQKLIGRWKNSFLNHNCQSRKQSEKWMDESPCFVTDCLIFMCKWEENVINRKPELLLLLGGTGFHVTKIQTLSLWLEQSYCLLTKITGPKVLLL